MLLSIQVEQSSHIVNQTKVVRRILRNSFSSPQNGYWSTVFTVWSAEKKGVRSPTKLCVKKSQDPITVDYRGN